MTDIESLTETLGPTLLSLMLAGDKSRKEVVSQIVTELSTVESPTTIRAWFMGMDPIDDRNPAELIADGHADEALAMARTYLENS